MTRRKVSFLQGTDAARYKLPAEDNRLNTAALWTPDTAGLRPRGGIAAGPGGPGLVTATVGGVNFAPASVMVPGSVSSVQGGYVCTWDASEFRAAPAASASQYRKITAVARVYDQANAGSKDDWDLEISLGAGAASLAAAPAAPVLDNSLVLGTGSVAPDGTVTITPVGPLTVARGGVLPTYDGDTAPGPYVGFVRSTPTGGIERWTATGTWEWIGGGAKAPSALITFAGGWDQWTSGTAYTEPCQVTRVGGMVHLTGIIKSLNAFGPMLSDCGYVPVGFRPPGARVLTRSITLGPGQGGGGQPPGSTPMWLDVSFTGTLTVHNALPVAAASWWAFDAHWPLF